MGRSMLQGAGTQFCRHYAITDCPSRAPRIDRVDRDGFGRCDAQRPMATPGRSGRTTTFGGTAHDTGRVAVKRAYEPGCAAVCARKRDCSTAREPPSKRSLQRRYPHKASSSLASPSPRVKGHPSCPPLLSGATRAQRVHSAYSRNPYAPRVFSDPYALSARRLCLHRKESSFGPCDRTPPDIRLRDSPYFNKRLLINNLRTVRTGIRLA